jgi:crotonobetainyl-CoA:carnitine CoA-transferase CaiB-like acyl-CoA transferase
MADAITSLSSSVAGTTLMQKEHSECKETSVIRGECPCYNVYETADGREITLGAIEKRFWQRFCEAIDREDLIDNHLASGERRKRTLEAVKQEFADRSYKEIAPALEQNDVPFGPVNSLTEAYDEPRVAMRNLLQTLDHPSAGRYQMVDFPAMFDTEFKTQHSPSPLAGQHTREILSEHGYTEDEIITLIADDVVFPKNGNS